MSSLLLRGLVFFLFFSIPILSQQQLKLPDVSQKSSVSQRIGLTDINIEYHSPLVNNREIWGKLVPYNQVWRAGANENTTISFTDPVMINGKELPAGKYGLHMIPTENEWTIIFNKNSWAWGSFFYDENDDVLRVKVSPQSADMQEWLSYTFENPTEDGVDAVLKWEKKKIKIPIRLDVHELVLNNFKKELDNLPGFFWQGWNQAANYAYQNNVHLDDAMVWVDRSISINRNFNNLITKANLLEENGKTSDAEKLKADAFEISNEGDVNTYGYQLLGAGKIDEALKIFKKNTQDYPKSWNVFDSLGEAYAIKGDKQLAKEYYSKALGMAPESQHNRIKQALAALD